MGCSNTYKEKLQHLIQSLREAGRESIYKGALLPVWGTELDEPYPEWLALAATSRRFLGLRYKPMLSLSFLETSVRTIPKPLFCLT